jgi:large subunit ribosomal protein L6
MSRIGKKNIIIPSNVFIKIFSDFIQIKGKYGILEQKINDNIKFILSNNILSILLINKEKKDYYGLMRSLVNNMIIGVNEKFRLNLYLEGIGYKFVLSNNILAVYVGYTHSIEFFVENDIEIKLESPIKINIMGIDYQKVTQFASKIYNICPPEPYKGKGIHYENQIIIKKIGKKSK